ncbi:50S ribosomal protein L32 [Candidatus Roizmanbacteria bacterium CG10_big_fil_rev_8_21_14_0_10_45_7]|uniref:Large ribosomal subunit protein bL32 n=1 Tax=Candidatus Roizmanbacteria bacterium CG10_big_fil_rev_8_21_14_0_10_45_7 TaxID=1974854 RepID=A0A2M8KVB6_9BACT|nr:MAG: 50S ribosomal protein L32 [Candidatus Roizmanbacteria bacterium CG10_big_fil_rev_8_21_14_0_10_45_7]
MAALPKRRSSTARKGARLNSRSKRIPHVVTCKECGAKKVAHHLCTSCGK